MILDVDVTIDGCNCDSFDWLSVRFVALVVMTDVTFVMAVDDGLSHIDISGCCDIVFVGGWRVRVDGLMKKWGGTDVVAKFCGNIDALIGADWKKYIIYLNFKMKINQFRSLLNK